MIKYFWLIYFISLNLLLAEDNFESRNTISFRVKLPHSLKIDIEQSLRLRGNEFSFRQTFTEATISYKVTEGLKILLPVRYAIFEEKIKRRISFGAHINISSMITQLAINLDFKEFMKKIRTQTN